MSTPAESQRAWTIAQAYDHLIAIYAEANALTMSRDERFAFLMLAVGDLSRRYRKRQEHLYAIALAQCFAWFTSVADDLLRVSVGELLATAMCEKYPASHCGYCGTSPCICKEEQRGEHVPSFATPTQRTWSLAQWQRHLQLLYGKSNQAGGVLRALNRLFEEVAEVGLLLYHADSFNEEVVELRRKFAREMTDILAWLFATAELLDINLQSVIIELYGHGCPVCKAAPCTCRSFEPLPGDGTLTHRFMRAGHLAHALT